MNLRQRYYQKFKCSVEDFVKVFGLIDSDVPVAVMVEERAPVLEPEPFQGALYDKINQIMEEANGKR